MWRIADRQIVNPLVLAPMAGVTESPFRLLCKEHGAGLVFTEFISSKGLVRQNDRTLDYLHYDAREKPLGVQIFGAEPEVLAEAAVFVASRGADIVDINLGCSVPKIVKQGSCAALLREPEKMRRVIRLVRRSVRIPVTVKMRLGWDRDEAVPLAHVAEEEGVDAIFLHGRTAKQLFRGEADWDAVRRVKEAVSVPVIGNGDVRTPLDAARMLERTGCDAVMIGRGALGNPWIFRRSLAYLQDGVLSPEPTQQERVSTALQHLRRQIQKDGEARGLRKIRKVLCSYAHGFRHASRLREKLVRALTYAEVEAILTASLTEERSQQPTFS